LYGHYTWLQITAPF